jgi:serine/threonine-protein kinase RsbW
MSKAGSDTVVLTLPCHPRYLSVARLLVGALGAQANLTVDDTDDLKVAVSEAVTNVIDHAYGEQEGGEIVVRFRPSPGELTVEVEDRGAGFEARKIDTTRVPPPGVEGGLGLYLAREMADQVKVESAPGSGTKITLTKHRHEET